MAAEDGLVALGNTNSLELRTPENTVESLPSYSEATCSSRKQSINSTTHGPFDEDGRTQIGVPLRAARLAHPYGC